MENELLKIGSAYVRVSTEKQDEYSPDSQLKKIREFAEREGYLIPDEYVFYDDGISGRSVKKRTDFNRMIAQFSNEESLWAQVEKELQDSSGNVAKFVYKINIFVLNQDLLMLLAILQYIPLHQMNESHYDPGLHLRF